MQSIAQEIAFYSKAVSRKYGRYPLRFETWVMGLPVPWWTPLAGHEDDEIPPFPDTSEKMMRIRPLNREDDRRRFKFYRQENFTKSLHQRVNDKRKVVVDGGS
jgi:hypothetical protein